jgi:hypothetical protein
MSHGTAHALVVKRLSRLGPMLEQRGFHLQTQLPVTLSETSEPEPDGAIVRGVAEDYSEGHPKPESIAAVIEAADSSLEYDRTTKQRIYATAGIPQYLVVNIPETRIEVYRGPVPAEGRYQQMTPIERGGIVEIELESAQPLNIPATDLLPATS